MRINLHEEENLRDVYRQHPMVLIKPLILSVLALGLPWYFLIRYELLYSFRWFAVLLAVVVLGLLLRELIIWRNNKYVITNKRLLLYSHDGLFKRSVIETPLERILNVSYKTTGVISVVFDFGNVEVQVVGLIEPIILKYISDPETIKDYIWELHKRVASKAGTYDAEDIQHYQEKVGYTKKNQRLL